MYQEHKICTSCWMSTLTPDATSVSIAMDSACPAESKLAKVMDVCHDHGLAAIHLCFIQVICFILYDLRVMNIVRVELFWIE